MTSPYRELFDVAQGPASDNIAITKVDGAAPSEASPHVIKTDRWGRRQGERIHEKVGYSTKATPEELTDAFQSLFVGNPELAENPQDKSRAEWWKEMMQSPAFDELRSSTKYNVAASYLASRPICEQWLAYKEKEGDCPGDKDGEGPGDKEGPGIDDLSDIEDALDDANDLAEAANGIGHSLGPEHTLQPEEIVKLVETMRNSKKIANIINTAGRFRMIMSSLQKTKSVHSYDEVVGLETSGQISRAIGSEKLKLCCGVPELELLQLGRLANKQLLSYKREGREALGKGPIVLTMDESGSMSGGRIVVAKALAMTTALMAKKQNRWFALVSFESGERNKCVVMPPDKIDYPALFQWLDHFYGGGTTLDVPLKVVPFTKWPEFIQQGMPRGKTDHIIVTDGHCTCGDAMAERYKEWAEKEEVQTYGLFVNSVIGGDLPKVCDHTYSVDPNNLRDPGFEAVLSI